MGTFEGRSAIWLLQNILTDPKSSITCVDVFDERLELFFDHNMRVLGLTGKVVKLKGKSQDVLRKMPRGGVFDFAYIDACHLATCTLTDASWSSTC